MDLRKEERFEDWPESGWRRTEALLAYGRNPRTHDDAQVAQLVRSMEEFGYTNPILIDETDTIIAGHGRCEAARRLNIKEIPVLVLKGLTEDKRRAYIIADNQLPMNASWDDGLLKLELEALKANDYDLGVIGFDDDFIAEFLDEPPAALTDPDDIPEAPEQAITKLGDVWQLGDHRVMCGDATDGEMVKSLLGDSEIFIVVTDPPYGVNYDPNWRVEAAEKGQLSYTPTRVDYIPKDDQYDWCEVLDHVSAQVVYMWCASWFLPEVGLAISARKYDRRALLIWKKERIAISRGHYNWQHEPCWYAVKKGKTAKWNGSRKESTVWDVPINIKQDEVRTTHGAQKPVELMERPLRNHGGKDDAVYDPFLGSGTTLIAAERQGRQCFGMEIDPKFCDVIVERWERYTGQKAVKA